MDKKFPVLFEVLAKALGSQDAAEKELDKLIARNKEQPKLDLEPTNDAYNSFVWAFTEQGHNYWRELFYKHDPRMYGISYRLSEVDSIEQLQRLRQSEEVKL